MKAQFLGLVALLGFAASAADQTTTQAYTAYRFEPDECWRATSPSNTGTTKLQGRTWHFDSSQGATHVGLTLPDHCLLTRPQRLRLRVRGEATGRPIHIYLRTHFMMFDKVVGQFMGKGEQELAFDAPPGEGWQWSRGENDDKLHGPLRVAEIRLEAGPNSDQGTLELLRLTVEGQYPTNRWYVLSAEQVSTWHGMVFRVEARPLATRVLSGTLRWVARDWEGQQK